MPVKPVLKPEQEYMLRENVSKNLKNLIEAMKWSQASFAKETGISEPALSNYLKGNETGGRLPTLEYLVGLCMNEEFKEKGLELTLDLLISEKFNPKALIQKKYNHPSASRKEIKHGDFLGNYLCYFFDQSKPVHNQDHKESRELRYGVVSIFDVYESLTGDVNVRAIAAFFKQDEEATAIELKRKLDLISKSDDVNLNSRNMAIEDAFKIDNVSAYEGAVTFSDHHTFINVQSNIHGDNALIILYSPQKKVDSDYIGGIGSVASIARGRTHMPTAQKIIMSKYKLGCTREVIAEKLSMSAAEIAQEHEAEAICHFCRKLYLEQDYAMHFDEADKAALIRRRLDQLVKNYIEKNICCVGSVTEDEDKAVFKLIEQYKD